METPTDRKPKALKERWTQLDGKKNGLLTASEEYARWTLPYVFPEQNTANVEHQVSQDSIGARAVNHLANKVVSTLFPPQRLFFRLAISEEARALVQEALEISGAANVEGAQEQLEKALIRVQEELAAVERRAKEHMDMVAYRPEATNATKLLIITGNALEYQTPQGTSRIYNLRDYAVVRDVNGEVIEGMTRETKAFATFSDHIQKQLRDGRPQGQKDYEDDAEVTIYTQWLLQNDGRFHVRQSANEVELDIGTVFYPKETLPWTPLVWNLVRGEDYGRGLVAEYSGAFHAVNVLQGSLLNLAAILGDIKFLVNPQSMLDLDELNKSPAGSYHPGKEGDISTNTAALGALNNAQFLAEMVSRYEKQISAAFLLASSMRRDAERVTAEEVRIDAYELETSNGGVYSRLASSWQQPKARLILDAIDFSAAEYGVVPQVITGMDSLSRQGELENLRMFFMDLAMLNGVPEDVRATLDLPALLSIIGTNHQVNYKQIVKSQEQLAADRQAAMNEANAMEDANAAREGQVAASKEIAKDA